MTIESLKIDTLKPYARNSRTHSPEQIGQIAASIREFGFTNPVLIDRKGGIIAGHGRVMAARELGMETVPCIRLANLTEAQRRAYVIADNQIAMQSGWDWDVLRFELSELTGDGFDLGLIGFDAAELDLIMDCGGEIDADSDADSDIVKIPEPKPPIECPHCRKFFVP